MSIIRTEQLDFYFTAKAPIVQQLNLDVPEASIFGFLGPNGAGKTTTIRLILGLLQPRSGSIRLFGEELNDNREPLFQRIGSLIEQPSLYLHLSGKQNLEIARRYTHTSAGRINEVLHLIGLEQAAHKSAKQYSLGMKQRLGLGMALLHKPDLLILDEPTNGLDPGGIIEMRELIKRLNQEWGTTIFVSSHLLTEVERMCTHVAIIHQGKLHFQGSLGDLKSAQMQRNILRLETSDPGKVQEWLAATYEVQRLPDGRLTVPYQSKEQIAQLNQQLVGRGIDVYELSVQHADLEEMFLEITR